VTPPPSAIRSRLSRTPLRGLVRTGGAAHSDRCRRPLPEHINMFSRSSNPSGRVILSSRVRAPSSVLNCRLFSPMNIAAAPWRPLRQAARKTDIRIETTFLGAQDSPPGRIFRSVVWLRPWKIDSARIVCARDSCAACVRRPSFLKNPIDSYADLTAERPAVA